MRAGANYSDVRRIKALAAEGSSAEEISEILRVDASCVASFMPAKPKRKRRTKAEIDAENGDSNDGSEENTEEEA